MDCTADHGIAWAWRHCVQLICSLGARKPGAILPTLLGRGLHILSQCDVLVHIDIYLSAESGQL